MNTLLSRGVILQAWQQRSLNRGDDRVHSNMPRQSGKTFLSYTIVLEDAVKHPGVPQIVLYMVDPDNQSYASIKRWVEGLHIFANTHYPDVIITGSFLASIYLQGTTPLQTKKQKLHEAVRGMR